MEQIIEFAGNHPVLSSAFVLVVLALIWSEVSRRAQGFSEVTTAQAVALINRENAQVIDVSSSADFNRGHIAGAKHVPPSRLDKPDPELGKLLKQPLLVTCKTGQAAPSAAAKLVKLGAPSVAVLKGGMQQWLADNYPVSRR